MKLEIKNLHNETFTVDCDGNDTIKQLKEKIAAKNDLREKYDPELLKLLYTGKVMDDEETVDSYSIKTDGFLVLVKQTPGKPKPPPKKKPNQGGFNNPMWGSGSNPFMQQQNMFGHQAFPQSSFGQSSFPQSSFGQSSFPQSSFGQSSFPQNPVGPQSNFPATGATGGLLDATSESFSTPEEREDSLQALLTMGFEKSQAEQALRASYYNLETAIEYITSGNIPVVDDPPAVSQATGPGKPSSSSLIQGNKPSPSPVLHQGGGGVTGANLQQMREMLKRDPAKLQVLKQTIQAEHPDIAKMIDDNPQAFLELLNQAGDEAGPAAGTTGGSSGQTPGPLSVTLSAQEQKIIDRLQDMGFERNRVIEAYLACDRNENLAVNYLLNAFD